MEDSLDLSILPQSDPHDQLSSTQNITPSKLSRKRKHSSFEVLPNDDVDSLVEHHDGFTPRRPRPPGTKRACNECRQQKLKCNVVEDPWRDCDRCRKHALSCQITADFKRVGKRSQQAELEKNNRALLEEVQRLSQELAIYRNGRTPDLESLYTRRLIDNREQVLTPGIPGLVPQDDDSHDAHLLLNLKQGHDLSGNAARASPVHLRKLGEVAVAHDTMDKLWEQYFTNYHIFLPLLDPEVDSPQSMWEKSEVLFWTVMLIASRHFAEDRTLILRLLVPYGELIKDTIATPPSNHYVVKALCLVCYWPPPVSSTTADMTFALSGVMMKFAMQLGLHRPSHPMDFSRERVQLREEDISDRLKTWAICNLVAQNVSTGYGQPPDTVYDSTLDGLHSSGKHAHLHTRLEIEKLADKITKTIYSSQHYDLGGGESPIQVKATIMAGDFQNLNHIGDIASPLNELYASAVNLHLRLFVFFDEPSSPRYRLDLNELYMAAQNYIKATFNCGTDIRYVPNYISQMMSAAAVALLRLIHSSCVEFIDVDSGERLFWDTIAAIRQHSVKTNDLPQRLAEVFAQMWKADGERLEMEYNSDNARNGDYPDAGLALKRRYRMSVSHVYDSIWRWKEELEGKVRAERLDAAVKNPTSPQSTTHRNSFSNGRRPSSGLMDEATTLPGMTSFGGFGGLTLGATSDLAYANSYEFFDPVGWYLDGLFEAPDMNFQ